MARINNAITFGSGFNITAESPIDSRTRVLHESDLVLAETWPLDKAPLYNGLSVVVEDTGDIWVIKDKNNYTDKTSGNGWVRIGSNKEIAEKNKLLYSYDNLNLTPDYLIPEKYNIAIVDNNEDFIKCKGKGIIEPDILSEFLQYSDTVYMPEYGKGRSYVEGNHLPPEPQATSSNEGIGYGRWYEDDGDENNKNKFIQNPVNSYEYCGYINPTKASYFNYDVLIGTDKGDTTGDWSGYALVNDDNAIPRHIKCSDGNIYYRNTLYDLTTVNGEKENPIAGDLWCAWVNEDKASDTADVIYGTQIQVSGKEYYEDEFPSGEVTVYKVLTTETKTDRKNYSSSYYKTVTVEETNEASGYVAALTILTNNSSGCRWLGIENDSSNPIINGTGTVSVFTNIIPCTEYDPMSFLADKFREIKVALESTNRCVLAKLDAITSDSLNGTDIVSYKHNLDSDKEAYINIDDPALITRPFYSKMYYVKFFVESEPSGAEEGDIWCTGNVNNPFKKFINGLWEDMLTTTSTVWFVDASNNKRIYFLSKSDNKFYWLVESMAYRYYWLIEGENKYVYAEPGTSTTDNNYTVIIKEYTPSQYDGCTFNEFIRSNVLFDNGTLTIKFSDVIGGPNPNNVFDKTFLNKETISTNFPFNSSKVVIDFNKSEYTVTKYDGTTLDPIKFS